MYVCLMNDSRFEHSSDADQQQKVEIDLRVA
jgi:hypothetical protein